MKQLSEAENLLLNAGMVCHVADSKRLTDEFITAVRALAQSLRPNESLGYLTIEWWGGLIEPIDLYHSIQKFFPRIFEGFDEATYKEYLFYDVWLPHHLKGKPIDAHTSGVIQGVENYAICGLHKFDNSQLDWLVCELSKGKDGNNLFEADQWMLADDINKYLKDNK